ncbi:MAG: methylmalonyl-CoA mutase [Desulfobacterales bacterium]|nr:MAG: methylmalonyl-CoA mutase [Desulfobacterales bacterium]
MREDLNILDDFPATPHEDWLAAVDKQLKGKPFEKVLVKKTYEGIPVQPMYFKHDLKGLPHTGSLPGFAPYVRGNRAQGNRIRAWRTAQEVLHPDPTGLNRALKKDLERGQDTVNIRLDQAARAGKVPDQSNQDMVGADGVSLATMQDWEKILKDIDISATPLMVDAGMQAPAAAALLAAGLDSQAGKLAMLTGCLGMDPLGELAKTGCLRMSFDAAYDAMAGLSQWAFTNAPELKTMLVDTDAYAHAGANAVQETAFALATATEYIRAMQERGLAVDGIFQGLQFVFSIGPDFFMEIAKFRAARMLWFTITEAFGATPEHRRMTIHGRTGRYNKTQIDPWVNMLRVSMETFSGIAGGCDSIHTGPFDEVLGMPDEFSRRIARNVQTLFKEESHFDKVADPAGGSWYVENITLALAKDAWALFQEIEGMGGMAKALSLGVVQEKTEAVAAVRAKNTAIRKDRIVGVNMYPNLTETPLTPRDERGPEFHQTRMDQMALDIKDRDESVWGNTLASLKAATGEKRMSLAVDAAVVGATLSEISDAMGYGTDDVSVQPMNIHRRAEPFENLRRSVEAEKEQAGDAGKIFMATIGPLARHKPRSDFSTAFFNVAAFETIFNPGFDSPEQAADAALASGCRAVVICGTDDDYLEAVPPMAKKIKAADPNILLILAGYSPAYVADFKAAGVDEFIHIRADALSILTQLKAHLMPGSGASAEVTHE